MINIKNIIKIIILVFFININNTQNAIASVSADVRIMSPAATAFTLDYKSCYPGNKYEKVESCFLCPVFVVVFNTVSNIGSLSAARFSESIMTVVVVGFALWLAIEIIKFASSLKNKDLKDFMQTVISRSFIVMMVLVILKIGVGSFYNIFVQPVYNTGQAMAQMMFDDQTANVSDEDKKALKDKSIAGLKEYKNGLPTSMGASIVKTMTMMENRVRRIKALGSALFCQSWKEAFLILFPKIKLFIFGSILWIFAVVLMVAIPFLLIDAVFQLGVATVLMPFAVGAYAFEYTRKKYCKKVFDTFLNSAFSFLFLSVIVLILLSAIQSSIENSIGTIKDFNEMFVAGSSKGDVAFATLKDSLTWGSGFLINLFFLFILTWSVMNTGKSFAGKFAGSLSSTGIGSKLGGTGASMLYGAGKKLTAPAQKGINMIVKSGARRIGSGVINYVSRVSFRRKSKKFDNTVTDNQGNKIYKDKKGYEHVMDSDGNITKRKLESNLRHNGTVKIETEEKEIRTKNVVIKIKKKTYLRLKNGNWEVEKVNVEERMKFISGDVSQIMNKDGTIALDKMKKVLEGTSGDVKDAIRRNMIRQINESRFSKGAFIPNSENLAKPADTIIDSSTGEITTKYLTKSNQIIISKTKIRDDGLVETRLVRIDKNGRVLTLESDGIRNKMTVRLMNDGVDAKNLKDINEIEANCKKDKDGNFIQVVGYSYTDYYKNQIYSGQMREKDVPNGMFFTLGSDGLTRDENGDVVRDINGNIVGGAFEKYREGYSRDDKFYWSDINFRKWGSSEENKDSRSLYRGHIFKGGNDYDLIEADMNFYFESSRSPKRFKNIFKDIRGN